MNKKCKTRLTLVPEVGKLTEKALSSYPLNIIFAIAFWTVHFTKGKKLTFILICVLSLLSALVGGYLLHKIGLFVWHSVSICCLQKSKFQEIPSKKYNLLNTHLKLSKQYDCRQFYVNLIMLNTQ